MSLMMPMIMFMMLMTMVMSLTFVFFTQFLTPTFSSFASGFENFPPNFFALRANSSWNDMMIATDTFYSLFYFL